MKVLLVDDEVELVTTLAERLSIRDIDTDWASTPQKALDLAESNEYSVAILDVRMPGGIDGFQLKRLLQAKHPAMKFMFYTGHDTEETYTKGIAETNERYFLTKPVDIDVIVQKVYELVQSMK